MKPAGWGTGVDSTSGDRPVRPVTRGPVPPANKGRHRISVYVSC